MKSLLKRIGTATLLKNVASLSFALVISQAVRVLSSPVLTRLFSPDEFGIQSIFVSITMVITVIYTLQYDMAIVLPKEEHESTRLKQNAAKFSIYSLFIFIIVACFVIFFKLHQIFIKSISGVVILLCALHAWFVSIERISNYSNVRKKRFKKISLGIGTGSIIATIFCIFTGYFWGGSFFLIFAVMLKSVTSTVIQNTGIKDPVYKILGKDLFIRTKEDKKLLTEYSAFPKYRMFQNLLNTLSQYLPALMFAFFFSPAVAGFYALARRIIQLPSNLISEALRKVYYQKAAELKNNNKPILRITFLFTIGLSIVGIIPYSILVLFSRSLFSFVFGIDWAEAGYFASWLSIWSFFGFMNVPAVSIIPVLGLQKQNFIFEIILIASRVISILIGVMLSSPRIAIIAFAITGAIINFLLISWVHLYLFKHEKKIPQMDKNHLSL